MLTNKPERKNILSKISNEALAAIVILIAGAMFYLGSLQKKYPNDVQNIELKQVLTKQQQTIKDLNDTILILKLNKGDTITSLQEPAHPIP